MEGVEEVGKEIGRVVDRASPQGKAEFQARPDEFACYCQMWIVSRGGNTPYPILMYHVQYCVLRAQSLSICTQHPGKHGTAMNTSYSWERTETIGKRRQASAAVVMVVGIVDNNK